MKKKLDWTIVSMLTRGLEVGDRMLSVQVAPIGSKWAVTAFETIKSPESISGVFNKHAHQVVSEGEPNLMSAIGAAEKFVRKWRRSKSLAACKCGPIGKKK